jgi:hypothetical protein
MFGRKRTRGVSDPQVQGAMRNCVNLMAIEAGQRAYGLMNQSDPDFYWDVFLNQADETRARDLAYVFARNCQGWEPFPSFRSHQWDRWSEWHESVGQPDLQGLQF